VLAVQAATLDDTLESFVIMLRFDQRDELPSAKLEAVRVQR
jgi:hypothetical protein